MATEVFIPGLKRPACESLHSLPSVVDTMNTRSCAVTLRIYIYGLAINQTQKYLRLHLHYCYNETDDICCHEISQIVLVFSLKLYSQKMLIQDANPHF